MPEMTIRPWRLIAFSVGGLATVLFVVTVVLGLAFDVPSEDRLGDLSWAFSNLLMAWVGSAIMAARPGNRVGVLLLLGGTAGVAFTFFKEWTLLSLSTGGLPGEALAAWLGAWLWFPALATLLMLMLVFPTGRPLTGWRWLWWTVVGLTVVGIMSTWSLWGVPTEVLIDPAATNEDAYFLLDTVVAPLMTLVLLPLALASLVIRFRRAGPSERSQIKWLVWAMGLSLSLLVASNFSADMQDTLGVVSTLAISLVPLAIAIAILRHRLYDIDRVISRTVSWGLISASLVGVYVGAVFILGELLPVQGELAVAASTLAVAALFDPLRRRVQDSVDRRFNRSRYDARRTVEEFGDRLRDEVELEHLGTDLATVAGRTMQPQTVSVWLREDAHQ